MRHIVNLLLADVAPLAADVFRRVCRQDGEARAYVQVFATRFDPSPAMTACLAAPREAFCSVPGDEWQGREGDPLAAATDDELTQVFSDLYRRTMTVDHAGDDPRLTLNVFLPLARAEALTWATRLAHILKALPSQWTLDVIAISTEKASPQPLRTLARQERDGSIHRVLLLEDRNTQGVSLNLDERQRAAIIAEYACLASECYTALFSPNDDPQPITTFGLTVLRFDRTYFLAALLRRAYIHLLEGEQVGQTEVLLSTVGPVAQDCLAGETHIYTTFYEREVRPRLIQRLPPQTILQEVAPLLKAETDHLQNVFTRFLSDPALTLPEKEATLACLLGLDDERIHDYALQASTPILDDCGSDALQVYIDENNRLVHRLTDAAGHPLSAPDGTPLWAGSLINVCVNPLDGHVRLPLDDIKQLRADIKDTTTYIRKKEEEMAALRQAQTDTGESQKRLTGDGFTFDGTTFRLLHDVEPQPLADTYAPHKTETQAVDLRSGFLPIEQQGALGACSTFALTSIYEYMLKACGTTLDLSALYVYYNVCEKDEEGRPTDSGSNFYDVIQSLETDGVCAETLCPYSADHFDRLRPTPEAIEDAKRHLVVKAMNVDITHEALTSALADGYPVAISLRLFDSFQPKAGGFIFRPSDDEIAGDDQGRHALVLVGYSEEEKVYIVRNSWGERFGDKGYCYIPFSYIEDKTLNANAVIITEVSAQAQFRPAVATRVDFDMRDEQIRSAVLHILIDEQHRLLAAQQQQYDCQRREYYLLAESLGTPQLRRSIREAAAQRLRQEQHVCDSTIENIKQQRPDMLAKLKREALKWKIAWGVTAAVWTLLLIVLITCSDWHEWTTSPSTYLTALAVVALFAFLYLGISWWRSRIHRLDDELRREADEAADRRHRIDQQLFSLDLRTQIAGMVIDEYHRLADAINKKHKMMHSYVGNLAEWLKEEKAALKQAHIESRTPYVEVFTDEELEEYAKKHVPELTKDIHLYTFLDDYHLTEEAITAFKRTRIKDVLLTALNEEVERVSMVERLMSDTKTNALPTLEMRSQAFAQAQQMRPGAFPAMVLLAATADENQLKSFQAFYPQHFSASPTLMPLSSPLRIVMLQTEGHTLEELALNKKTK